MAQARRNQPVLRLLPAVTEQVSAVTPKRPETEADAVRRQVMQVFHDLTIDGDEGLHRALLVMLAPLAASLPMRVAVR